MILRKMGEVDFVVLKINGQNVEHLSRDEAVQAFLKSDEPVQIEIQQRSRTSVDSNQSVSTDSYESSGNVLAQDRYASLILTLRSGQPTTTQATQTDIPLSSLKMHMDKESNLEANDRLIEEEHVLFDQCLAPEIDIEEVTLRKSKSNELLGLSVVYSADDNVSKTNSGDSNNEGGGSYPTPGYSTNESNTEVFISHIHEDSVAARDGRLRQGDQILQINGKDVKTKEEAETLIAENNNAVTLLVSRYLYTDDDDFNDPSIVVDLEVEDEDNERDETEEDDGEDEADEDLYVENHLAYGNCLNTNNTFRLVDNLDKMLLAQKAKNALSESNAACTLPITRRSAQRDECKNILSAIQTNQERASSKNYQTQNTEIRRIDSKESKIATNHNDDKDNKGSTVRLNAEKYNLPSQKISKTIASPYGVDSETEHIYETIPEDSETEPFYCSPYESSTYVNAVGTCSSSNSTNAEAFHLQQHQKQRVAQWLGICSSNNTAQTMLPRRTLPMFAGANLTNPSMQESNLSSRNNNKAADIVRTVLTTVTTNFSSNSGGVGGVGDIVSLVNHLEEQDNSSSAYNTGGSNASANQVRNEPTTKLPPDDVLHTPIANRANNKRAVGISNKQLSKDKEKANKLPNNSRNSNNGRFGCEESTIPDTLVRLYPPSTQTQNPKSDRPNLANKDVVFRTINKTTVQQKFGPNKNLSALCPNFTAPNLRQYHFVSSQEVSALHMGNVGAANDAIASRNFQTLEATTSQQQQQPTMVWKVKRRPDGTRYIVRRPAVLPINGSTSGTVANRLLRCNRLLRNTEHPHIDVTTTEDDTISEVKIGRYWSKEERKKHVERARERRQQQQQQQQHQNQIERQSLESTIRISDKMFARLQQHRKQRQRETAALKDQHQDLQFGGSKNIKLPFQTQPSNIATSTIATATTCDLQSSNSIKLPSATAPKTIPALQQQHQFINNSHTITTTTTNEGSTTIFPQQATLDANGPCENCSCSPPLIMQ